MSLTTADIPIIQQAIQQTLLAQYRAAVLALAPTLYVPMQAASGVTEVNLGSAGAGANGTYSNSGGTLSNITLAQPGAVADGSFSVAIASGGTLSGSGLADVSAGEAYSIAVWVNPDTSAFSRGVVAAAPGKAGAIGISNSGGSTAGVQFMNNAGVYSGTHAIPAGAWSHIVFVYTASVVTIYVNGSQIDSEGFPILSGSGDWQVGGALYWDNFVGSVAHVAMWAGTSLTAAQIAALYTAGSTVALSPVVNVGQWAGLAVPAVLPNAGPVTLTAAAYDAVARTILGYGLSDSPGASCVVNRAKTLPYFCGARYERAVFIGIGDSNQVKDGYGWMGGIAYALANSAPIWGTGLIAQDDEGGGIAQGYYCSSGGDDPLTGAPTELDAYAPDVAGVPSYCYIASGEPGEFFYLDVGWPGSPQAAAGVAGNLSLHLTYGVYPGWTGTFTMGGSYDSGTQASLPAFLPAAASTSTDASTVSVADVVLTSDSPDVTCTSTAGLSAGQLFVGANVPANATISSITSGTAFVLSANATGTASGSYVAGSAALVDGTWEYAAGMIDTSRNLRFDFGTRGTSTGSGSGPMFLTYWQAENRDIHSGFAAHTLGFYGGVSTKVMLQSLQSWGLPAIQEHFRQAMLYAGPDKLCCIRICEGLNDRNDSTASWDKTSQAFDGPAGDTQQGFYNNTEGIMLLLQQAWGQGLGYPASSLYFELCVSHPQSLPDDSQLASYRAATDALSAAYANTCSVHLEQVTSFAELSYNEYYESGTPGVGQAAASPHLITAGYNYVATLEVAALQPTGVEVVMDAANRALAAAMPPNPAGAGPYALTTNGGTGAGGAAITGNGTAIGTDGLRVLDAAGNGIDGAVLRLYAASDSTLSNVLGTATTGHDGRWLGPIYCASGSYQLVTSALGEQSEIESIVVP